jgi:hypothetical protein
VLVEGVSYDVDWSKFKKGDSIFVPCLDCKTAKKSVKNIVRTMDMDVFIKVTIEDKIRGLRVWRI